jgi:hypothetical protein
MTGNLTFQSLTPILYVNAIEPCLPFWVERLGFAVTISVPEGDTLGFVARARDGVELMYQTHATMAKDQSARRRVLHIQHIVNATIDAIAVRGFPRPVAARQKCHHAKTRDGRLGAWLSRKRAILVLH